MGPLSWLRKLTSKSDTRPRNDFDAGRQRRRLSSWQPSKGTTNTLVSQYGELLRSRARDVARNNAYASAAIASFAANLIGTGIKPSSSITDNPTLRKDLMQLFSDWTDEADADGIADFYGLQTMVAICLMEAGECFIRFRPRLASDGLSVPLQIQLLESEMCPYSKNERHGNGNYIMNGIEMDFRGKRAAYWFYPIHPGDAPVEAVGLGSAVRVPASEVLHVFKPTRPGQMRGVPLLTPALTRMFLLDQYDDAELERKKLAACYAGFVTSPAPEDIIAAPSDTEKQNVAQPLPDGVALGSLEPGTMQTLLPGETITFSDPADVGGTYEAYQYRQQLALFGALGIPYSVCTSDLRRANYSSLRGSIVEYRRKLEQMQFNVIVFQMCRPIWARWLETAVLASAIKGLDAGAYNKAPRDFTRATWIPQRNDWVDPLKDLQAEKLAVDAGFKPRSGTVESMGMDPEENDERIAADHAREDLLGLDFSPAPPAPFGGDAGGGGEEKGDKEEAEQQKLDAEDAEDEKAA